MEAKLLKQYSTHNRTNDYRIKEDSLYEILTQKYPSKNTRRHKKKEHHTRHRNKIRGSKTRKNNIYKHGTRDTIVPIMYSSSRRIDDKKQQIGFIDCILQILRENEFIQNVCIPFFEPAKCKCKDADEQTDQALIVERMPALSPELYIQENVRDPEFASTITEIEYNELGMSHNKIERSTSVTEVEITKQNLHTQTDHLNIMEHVSPMKKNTSSEICRILKYLMPLYREHQKKRIVCNELSQQAKPVESWQDWWKQMSEQNKQCGENIGKSPQRMNTENLSMLGNVDTSKKDYFPDNSYLDQDIEGKASNEICYCKDNEEIIQKREGNVSGGRKHGERLNFNDNIKQVTDEEMCFCKNNEEITQRDARSDQLQHQKSFYSNQNEQGDMSEECFCETDDERSYEQNCCDLEESYDKYFCAEIVSEELSNGKYSYDREISRSTLITLTKEIRSGETCKKKHQSCTRKQAIELDQRKIKYKTTQCSPICFGSKEKWKRLKSKIHQLEQITYRDFDKCRCFDNNKFFATKPLRYTCHRYVKKKPKICDNAAMHECWYEFNYLCYHIWCEICCCISVVLTVVIFVIYLIYIR